MPRFALCASRGKNCYPLNLFIGISYCRLLLHDTMLMEEEDAYRTGLSDTPTCECGPLWCS